MCSSYLPHARSETKVNSSLQALPHLATDDNKVTQVSYGDIDSLPDITPDAPQAHNTDNYFKHELSLPEYYSSTRITTTPDCTNTHAVAHKQLLPVTNELSLPGTAPEGVASTHNINAANHELLSVISGSTGSPIFLPGPVLEDSQPTHEADVIPGHIPEESITPVVYNIDAPCIVDLNTARPGYPHKDQTTGQIFPDHAIARAANLISDIWPLPVTSAKEKYPDFCALYSTIKQHNLPNFLGARVALKSGLNIDTWYEYLSDYHDPLLPEFLKFGWPLGYNIPEVPATTVDNHPSALFHLKAVNDFVATELTYDAIIGPFDEDPFEPWFRTSPLMTRAKKGTDERRIIVDLSFPPKKSVNDGIDPSDHFGMDITYSLPTIADLITQLQQHGKGAYLWKADLRRAYRQIRSDPLDSPFLGIKVGSKIYIDRCPPFGCRSSASICQRMANAIVFIMAKDNHTITAYLDDLGGCHPSLNSATHAYQRFLNLASELGLELSPNKCSPPSTAVEWLGYHVDSTNLSITIPTEKLQEVLSECERWLNRDRASKRMIQAIIGKLIFISNCIRPGRKFLARILATLRNMKDNTWTTLSQHFKADLRWFLHYAKEANGILLCTPSKPILQIECDSSLQAGGGNTEGFYYAWRYTSSHKQAYPQIFQLEAINIVVAYKTLAPALDVSPAHVIVWTDNITSSYALQTGRTKDSLLASCARELWLLAAKLNHHIEIKHKSGAQLQLADALSRMFHHPEKAALAKRLTRAQRLRSLPPAIEGYKFFDTSL